MKQFMMGWGLVFLSAIFDSYAAFIVKWKFNQLGKIDFSTWDSFCNYMVNFFKSPLLLTALITFIAAPALWFVALNKLDLSLAYPVLVGLHLVFVFFLGVFVLGESATTNKLIGTSLIFISLYFFFK